jgi:UDP-N-acetylmuramyl pentapeptide phosphotransferase/UDP-N-acetylglucosamine-1-phosphate transferase
VSWLALAVLRRSGRLPVDTPNARSLHHLPIPRGGGIAIWAGMLAGSAWLPQSQPWLASLLLLIGVSLLDDRRGISVSVRLAVQVAAAIGWLMLDARIAWPHTLLAVLVIAWMTNLYNFMDGSDGLAAAMTVIGFGAYAIAASRVSFSDAPIIATIVAATIPFLALNFPPSRIMLGDVGAVPLGFLAAVFGIGGWRAGYWPPWFPVLVFLPFIADATLTLARRILSRAKVWQAHRDHYYQRLVCMGFGHRGTLVIYSALMAGTAISALAALIRAPDAGARVLALWIAALLLLYAGIGYHWNRGNKGLNESKC